MSKIAAVKTTKNEKVRDAKRAFILGLMDLSWKLAASFLVPVGVGLAVDSGRGDSKTFTTIGIFVGLLFAFLVIIQIAKESGVSK